jgi:hypothetical protein
MRQRSISCFAASDALSGRLEGQGTRRNAAVGSHGTDMRASDGWIWSRPSPARTRKKTTRTVIPAPDIQLVRERTFGAGVAAVRPPDTGPRRNHSMPAPWTTRRSSACAPVLLPSAPPSHRGDRAGVGLRCLGWTYSPLCRRLRRAERLTWHTQNLYQDCRKRQQAPSRPSAALAARRSPPRHRSSSAIAAPPMPPLAENLPRRPSPAARPEPISLRSSGPLVLQVEVFATPP